MEAKEGSKQGSCASKSCLCYAATLCLGLITSIPIMKGRSTSGITTVPSACKEGEEGEIRSSWNSNRALSEQERDRQPAGASKRDAAGTR